MINNHSNLTNHLKNIRGVSIYVNVQDFKKCPETNLKVNFFRILLLTTCNRQLANLQNIFDLIGKDDMCRWPIMHHRYSLA